MRHCKVFFLAAIALALLTTPARALDIPDTVREAVPLGLIEAAGEGGSPLSGAASWLWDAIRSAAGGALRAGVKNAALLMLVALICGAAEGVGGAAGEEAARYVPYCGVLAIAALATGDLRALIGLGAETVGELGALAKLLLPALAASMAAGGFAGTASVWQVTTLMACDLLGDAIGSLLLPLVYCYIGAAAADAVLTESRLELLAEGIRKLVSWGLCAAMAVFTAYLSLAGVLTGSADRTAVKVAKAAISGAVPVVGGVLSDAAEGVLAAAGTARGTIGALGVFAILALCVTPLLRLGAQFVLYKLAAFVSGLAGTQAVGKFLDALGEAFALVFAMTAACALLLLIALLIATTMAVG